MWFKKQVAGRPFGKWESFEDKDWRRAYQFIEDIQEGRVVPDPSYINDKGSKARAVPEGVDPETGEVLDYTPPNEAAEIRETAMDLFPDDDIDQTNPNEEDK